MKTQNENEPRRLLRPAEFADLVGVSKKRISNLLSARKIPGQIRLPGMGWRISYPLFMKLVEENAIVVTTWETR